MSRKAPPNALFVRASLEALPAELNGLAHEVSVNFPWGSLLVGVLQPQGDAVRALRALCREGAELRITTSIDGARDAAMLAALPPRFLDKTHQELLTAEYAAAGLELCAITELRDADARAVGTTWARKLASNPGRTAWQLTFVARELHGSRCATVSRVR